MLVEAYLLCQVHNDVKQLAKQMIETGKSMICQYTYTTYNEEELEEGI